MSEKIEALRRAFVDALAKDARGWSPNINCYAPAKALLAALAEREKGHYCGFCDKRTNHKTVDCPPAPKPVPLYVRVTDHEGVPLYEGKVPTVAPPEEPTRSVEEALMDITCAQSPQSVTLAHEALRISLATRKET